MADTLTPEQRKRCMSLNRGSNTKPELRLRKALWSHGLRYRIKNKLPGRPDIVFPASRLVVFVDGCFWHGCQEHYSAPVTNAAFWANKIERNKERHIEVEQQLRQGGWEVVRFWEHEIKNNMDVCIESVWRALSTFSSQLVSD